MQPIFPANPIEKVGYYGGRIAEGFLGEPLNLASNICFVVLIIIFFMKLRKQGFSDKPVLSLIALGGLVGLGSIIFHSHPNRVTLQIDLIPITIFGFAYVTFTVRRFFNHSVKSSVFAAFAFLLVSMAFEKAISGFRIPGLHHIPSIIVLIITGVLLSKNSLQNKAARAFMIAAGFYVIALLFRYLDFFIYRSFPLGTHFLWHSSTSCVIGILLYTAVNYGSAVNNETLQRF